MTNKILAGIVSVLVLASTARADLYGLSSGNPGALYSISTTTGAATLVTPISDLVSFTGLELVNGTFYATDVFAAGAQFGSIDPSTGVFTAINNQGGSANLHGLAFNPNNQLFYAVDINNGNTLISITLAGAINNIGGAGIDGRGMAYDPATNTLYATGSGGITSLYSINMSTGAATLIGSMGSNFALAGLAVDNGALFLVGVPGGNTGISNLYSVNTTTGATTLIGSTGVENLDGLASGSLVAATVPEPASIALWSLVSVAGAIAYRRRKRAIAA